MTSIFNDPRLMQMAGLAVMGGKPLGDALAGAQEAIAIQDYRQAQAERQQYEMQQMQQQQAAMQQMQEALASGQLDLSDPATRAGLIAAGIPIDALNAVSPKTELVTSQDAWGNPILIDKSTGSGMRVNIGGEEPYLAASSEEINAPISNDSAPISRLIERRRQLAEKISSGSIPPKMVDSYSKQLKSLDDAINSQQTTENLKDTAITTLGLIDKLESHPGFEGAVGAKNISQFFGLKDKPIAGTQEANFVALLEQLGGIQFLQAYSQLKGGGAISEAEGKKAEQAIAALSTAQDEKQFIQSLNEFKTIVSKASERLGADAPKKQQFKDGQTATNPQTGEKIVFRGGQWVAQ